MDALSQETIDQYFTLLREVYEEHGFEATPAQIYNMDETGMPLDPRPPKVVARKGQKKVRSRTSGNKSQITVLGCVNCTGQAIPPMVIFDTQKLNREWTKTELPGTIYGLSEKGWIDQELFKGWLTDHFSKHAVSARPLLLMLDGHSSHYEPSTLHFAKEHGIVMFCLPPHTTHEAQPLDCGIFGPLKVHWRAVCHEYTQQNPGKVITKFQFSELLSKAWLKAMTPENIMAGFRTTGVYPLNPSAITPTESQTKSKNPAEQETSTAMPTSSSTSTTVESDSLHQTLSLGREATSEWSAEQIELFEHRYEEGYDIPDPEYIAWLELNHPEAVPSDRYSLVPSTPSETVSGAFAHVRPSVPLDMLPPGGPTVAVGLSTVATSSVLETPTSTQASPSLTSPSPTGSNRQLFGSQESVSPTFV
jgi:hypothetical protein